MAKLIATLRDNTTGETKTIEQDCPFDGDPDQGHYAAFHWTDGSFGEDLATSAAGGGDAMRSACQAIVIRYAPDPSGGEVLNIGVVLLAPAAGFFGARFVDSWSRITGAFPEADIVHLRRIASAVESTCAAHADAQISLEPQQDVVKAFEQIVPVEDASLAHSAAVSGVTSDPQRTLDELFARYVQPKARRTERESRPDHAVWRGIEPVLRSFGVLGRLTSLTLKSKHYEERFDAAWKNSRWNVAGPLSLDLIDPQRIVQKAASWTGRIISLRALLFYGDENYPSHLRQRDDREGVQCGENAFTLERLVVGGEVVVRDNEELDNYENT